MKKIEINHDLEDMLFLMRVFIKEKFPKGSPQREHAIAHVTLFIKWIEENIK